MSSQSVNKPTHEAQSEAHKIFRQHKGHGNHKTGKSDEEVVPGIIHPGATGVIYCSDRAAANGYSASDDDWANMGQGAPEVGHIPDAPERKMVIDINALGGDPINEYAPTTGVKELRTAVANLYNTFHREGKESKYTFENVCIVPGGRAGMSRVAAVVGDVFCGYQLPEYTAYSDSLSVFKRLVPIPTILDAKDKYELDLDGLETEIKEKGLAVVVASNPRNPTGQMIAGEKLEALVELTRRNHITTVLDEFYSFYLYQEGQEGQALSSAKYVHDVNEDNVVIIDGLTKGFRLPGWRVCWIVGPKELISAVAQSGSFLDGGANHPLQMAAVSLLEPSRVKQDIISLQKHFKMKRDYCLKRLEAMGLPVEVPPVATFYLWVNLEKLPEPISSGLVFFEELLKEKTILIPGIFFDVNPSHRRQLFDSPCHHFVRLSFGPPLAELEKGLDAIERLVKRADTEAHTMGKSFAPTKNKTGVAGHHA